MREARTLLIGLLLASTALAGCFGDDPAPTAYNVSASGGTAADGWAYDGTGLVDAGASLEGYADAEANQGIFNASFEAWNSTWTVTYDTFSGAEDFKDGGIALDVVEHGDSDNGPPTIPRVDARMMTWGSAEVLRDGEPYAIGEGSEGLWYAHLMLSKTTIRGADGLIAKNSSNEAYDPNAPSDARIIQDDPQALFELRAPSGPDSNRAPVNVSETGSMQGLDAASDPIEVPLETGPYASASINVTASGAEGVGQAGDIQVSIQDANGTALAGGSGEVLPTMGYSETFELADFEGPSTVVVRGNGTYDVSVTGLVTYDDHAHITLTFDDYALEAR